MPFFINPILYRFYKKKWDWVLLNSLGHKEVNYSRNLSYTNWYPHLNLEYKNFSDGFKELNHSFSIKKYKLLS